MEAVDKKTRFFARLALLTISVVWGSSYVAVSSTTDFFQPAFLLAWRYSISFVLLSIVFFRKLKKLDKTCLLAGLWIGTVNFAGYFLQASAITTAGGDPGRSSFLVATYCVQVPFVAWLIFKKRPNKFNIIAGLLCFIGIAIIALPDLISAKDVGWNWGDILSLISSVVFAYSLVAIEKRAPNLDTVLFSITSFFFSAILAWLYTLLFEDNTATVWNQQSIATLSYLAIFSTSLAYLLQIFGQKYTLSSTAALFFALQSVFGLGFSVLFGYEKLSVGLILGGTFIVLSIIVSETKFKFGGKKLIVKQ